MKMDRATPEPMRITLFRFAFQCDEEQRIRNGLNSKRSSNQMKLENEQNAEKYEKK